MPFETARELVSDFQAFQSGREGAPACKVYEYELISIHENAGEREGRAENAKSSEQAGSGKRMGIAALDFRKIAAIHGFAPYS